MPQPPSAARTGADLHCHSTASDGTRPPAEVVRRAAAAGVGMLALTDHDTADGLAEAEAALPPGMALVPGMELSCRRDGRSVHLLAYLFDPADAALARQCRAVRDGRLGRARAMVARLAALGAPVTWEQVTAIAAGGVVGRPHIARALVQAGVVGSVAEAFMPDWIAADGRAYVPRYAPDPAAAVALVRAAGGVSVLAHPCRPGGKVPAGLLAELAAAGLGGVEVDHPDHDRAARAALRDLAGELGLAVTGGSDDHGALTRDRVGCERTEPDVVSRLLAAGTGAAVITG